MIDEEVRSMDASKFIMFGFYPEWLRGFHAVTMHAKMCQYIPMRDRIFIRPESTSASKSNTTPRSSGSLTARSASRMLSPRLWV